MQLIRFNIGNIKVEAIADKDIQHTNKLLGEVLHAPMRAFMYDSYGIVSKSKQYGTVGNIIGDAMVMHAWQHIGA